MKGNTKKIKKVLGDLPTEQPSDKFMDNLNRDIDGDVDTGFPKWDEVSFDDGTGGVHIGGGLYAHRWVWNTWIGLLWVILSYPLYVGMLNAYTTDDVTPIEILTPIVIPIEPIEIPVEVIPVLDIEVDEVLDDNINDTSVAKPFIWETDVTFSGAFKTARSFLGPNKVFTWHGKEYTTLFKEEVALYHDGATHKW